MMCWHRNRINGRCLGTARPFPLWRLHSGPQSSSVDQYSEKPPEHLPLTIAEAMRRSVVTRHCLSKNSTPKRGVCRVVSALTSISRAIRRWALHHHSDKSLQDLAKMYNPLLVSKTVLHCGTGL